MLGGDFEQRWERVLHDGLLAGQRAAARRRSTVTPRQRRELAAAARRRRRALEIVFRPSPAVYDGALRQQRVAAGAARAGQQADLGQRRALSADRRRRRSGSRDGDVVTLDGRRARARAPVLVLPGQADGSIALALGYGRRGGGPRRQRRRLQRLSAAHDRGARLRTAASRVAKAAGTHVLALTHEHWSMEGRDIVREATVEEFRQRARAWRASDEATAALVSPWEERDVRRRARSGA